MRPITRALLTLGAVTSALTPTPPRVLTAQTVGAASPSTVAGDSLRLSALQSDAARLDPRARQLALHAAETDLHLRNIAAERLPALSGNGQAQYQSAVTTFGGSGGLPGGFSIPTPPHDTYDAHLNAQQSIFDPTVAPRRSVERAELAESQAQIRSTIYPVRQEVSDAFFAALTAQERARQLRAAMDDLDERLRETATQFRLGAALAGDTAIFAASLFEREQDLLQARADRAAALGRLSELIGRTVGDSEPLAIPALGPAAAAALHALDQVRARPEYARYAATRDRLSVQESMESAQEKPKVSAFARVGYGKPGLNMVNTNFQSYWLAGIQVEWTPWMWGTVDRNRQALELQQQIATTDEQAFTEMLRGAVQQSIATMTRLDSTVAYDDRIVALRQTVDAENRTKLREHAIVSSDYLDRYTELATARLARAQHIVQLAQARANFLTTLGVELP